MIEKIHMLHITADPLMGLRKQKVQFSILMTPQSAAQCHQAVSDKIITELV